MEKLVKHTGLAVPLNMANVDTDQLMPKQFLKWVTREGYGEVLFFDWRYLEDGSPNPEFVLNHERYDKASVLISQENFGSGSSREHAPWGLTQYGFRAVIAPSFADIFKNNSFNNGLLLIRLEQELVDEWMKRVEANHGYTISIDLPGQTITGSDGFSCSFEIDPFHKHCLLEGLDAIGRTLEHEAAIKKYEDSHQSPWQAAVTD